MCLGLVLALGLIGWTSVSWAAGAWYLSPGGSDSHGDGSRQRPWRTIGYYQKRAAPPKIRVDREHHRFLDATGKPFVPFGVNYYRPGTGWAPQLWKQFDAKATRRDFARLKRQGANVVRVF